MHDLEQEIKEKKLIQLNTQKTMEVPVYVAKLKSKPLGPVGMTVWNFFEDYV